MTLPAHVPRQFKDAVVAFAGTLRRNFAVRTPANPEGRLKGPMLALLQAAPANAQPRTEAQVEGLGACPDIGVAVRSLLCGYVELKAPGDRRPLPKMRTEFGWEGKCDEYGEKPRNPLEQST